MQKEKYTLENRTISEIYDKADFYARNKDVWLHLKDSIYYFII